MGAILPRMPGTAVQELVAVMTGLSKAVDRMARNGLPNMMGSTASRESVCASSCFCINLSV